MKITELDGLIKLEADKGKVLTTLVSSNLITTLIYLGIGDSADNYIEIDEVPEIELPLYEEPDLEEPEEVLNGYTLVEAYHHLLNENRVLKEENKKQDELIDITLMATDQMYCLLEPLLANMYAEGEAINPLVNMYVAMVQRGLLKTIEQVPEK